MQLVNQDPTRPFRNNPPRDARPNAANRSPAATSSPVLQDATTTTEAPLALWQALDLLLEASALIQDHDSELAGLTMLSTIAVAERVGLPDKALHFMWQSVCAAAKRKQRRAAQRQVATKSRKGA